MSQKIPLFKIFYDEEDIKVVEEAIKAGMHWAIGPKIEELERNIANYLGINYCVVFNSGTSALHADLKAHGTGKGDEVIVPSFTFIATANAALFVDAKPVFADIEEQTFGLDPESVKDKITTKTKAIIPVHYGGCPCNIKDLKTIADQNNLLLIEDAAESFGAKIDGKSVGTFGDSAMFSFCQTKVFTTGEGGCIVTDSKDLYEKLKLLRSHGRAEDSKYFSSGEYMDYVALGYNFRMSNILASLGVSQLKKVDNLIKIRRKKAEYMNKKLLEISEVETLNSQSNHFPVYQMFTIRMKNNAKKRDALKKYLESKGIMTKIYFDPVHLTNFYKNLGYRCRLPVTEKVSKEVLTLPFYPSLKLEEINYIVDNIKNFLIRMDKK